MFCDMLCTMPPGEPWPGPDEPPSPDGGPRSNQRPAEQRSAA